MIITMKKCSEILAFSLIIGGVIGGIAGCGKETQGAKVKEFEIPETAVSIDAEVADVYGNAKAIVTIISDDGVYDSCVNIDKIFGDRGLRCTCAGAINLVEPYKAEWEELLKHGNIDLVSHSYNHIRMEDGTEISDNVEALKHEIVDADKWYEDWLGYEQIVFVCPENQMCEEGYKILGENNFWSVRKGHRGYNPLSPEEGTEFGQWSNLMVQGICDDDVDLDVRNGWIDTAITDKTWLIEMWHNVKPEEDGGYQTLLIKDAEEHLNYVAEKVNSNDIWGATYTEAVKYIREKQNVSVNAYIDGDELHMFIELTNPEMSYDTFNQPLTVLLTLPDVYSEQKSTLVNVVPGEEKVIELVGE